MILVHEEADLEDMIRIVARDVGVSAALVEKDYWVTHSLWALHTLGLEVWFKGGTSLSKGFGLIRRFSEDLDLQIEAGPQSALPRVGSWTGSRKGQVAVRRGFFEALAQLIKVPGAIVRLDPNSFGDDARSASFQVRYPGTLVGEIHASMRPFVLLEVGQAQVKPFVERALSSFVHEWLEKRGQLHQYKENRPARVRCVHPLVTLVEKIEAIARRYPRGDHPAAFIRHYEDSARIIEAESSLPVLEGGLGSLIESMIKEKRLRALPTLDDPAFALPDPVRRSELERAHEAIAPMFWEDRLTLREACKSIQAWLSRL